MNKQPRKFFHADWHFKHKNILTLCNRNFKTINEHDEYLIERINATVNNNDILYVLGDLGCHKDINSLRQYLKRINGNIHVILGNHDHLADLTKLKQEGVICDVKEFKTVQEGNKHLICCHYPLKEWNGYYRGYYHVFGHVHGTIQPYDNCMDVGVDAIGFDPIEFNEVIKRIENKKSTKKIRPTDKKIAQYFPGLNTHYFVGLCTGHPEIRNVIRKVLQEGSKGFVNE